MNNENVLYEKVLEISKTKISELTWNNILFEANLDINNVDEKADSEQVSLLQNQLQELNGQIENLTQQNTNLDTEKNELLNQFNDEKNELLNQFNDGKKEQEKLRNISSNFEKTNGNLERKITRSENEIKSLKKQLADQQLATNELSQAKDILESNIITADEDNNRLSVEIENLKVDLNKNKNSQDGTKKTINDLKIEIQQKEEGFNRIQSKLEDSADIISKLTQEKGDIESALATQRNLYNELRSKTNSVIEEVVEDVFKVEESDNIQDEGVLESASS